MMTKLQFYCRTKILHSNFLLFPFYTNYFRSGTLLTSFKLLYTYNSTYINTKINVDFHVLLEQEDIDFDCEVKKSTG